MESPATNDQIAELSRQLDALRKRLEPDELGKSIDRSYLSVNNLRAFLQILAIVMTIFVAAVFYFGWVGLSNVLHIQEEARRVEKIRERVAIAEKDINTKVAIVDKAIPVLQEKIKQEVAQLRGATDQQIKKLTDDVQRVSSNLKRISQIFNTAAISQKQLLNAREKQLLILLAREIDPDNPVFRYNAAHWALSFRRYDEAIGHIDAALEADSLSTDLRDRAEKLRTKAKNLKENPVQLQSEKAEGVTVGPYGIIAFSVNILHSLVNNGLLTVQQAQEVIDDSRSKR